MRIGRLMTVRLYLLQQVGSNSFLVAGTDQTSAKDHSSRDQNSRDPSFKESRDQTQLKYKVNIGPQVCIKVFCFILKRRCNFWIRLLKLFFRSKVLVKKYSFKKSKKTQGRCQKQQFEKFT